MRNEELNKKLREIRQGISRLLEGQSVIMTALAISSMKENFIMRTLDEAVAAVERSNTIEDSYIQFLKGLQGTMQAAGLTPEDQAKVNKIFEDAEARSEVISAAMLANTPAADVIPSAAGAGVNE